MATFETRFGGSLPTRMNVQETPTAMSDVLATKLGLKVYSHGTTYNGGIAPTITQAGGSGMVVKSSRMMPYQMQDGTWRLRFQISFTATSNTSNTYTINSVFWQADGAAGFYALYAAAASGNGLDCNAAADSNTSGTVQSFSVRKPNSVAYTDHAVSGDVGLASKPTWAY